MRRGTMKPTKEKFILLDANKCSTKTRNPQPEDFKQVIGEMTIYRRASTYNTEKRIRKSYLVVDLKGASMPAVEPSKKLTDNDVQAILELEKKDIIKEHLSNINIDGSKLLKLSKEDLIELIKLKG